MIKCLVKECNANVNGESSVLALNGTCHKLCVCMYNGVWFMGRLVPLYSCSPDCFVCVCVCVCVHLRTFVPARVCGVYHLPLMGH